MKTRLPAITSPEFQSAIAGLVKEIAPAAIVCFGYSSSVVSQRSCFYVTSSEQLHYDLLIVRSYSDGHKEGEVIDLVKKHFAERISLNVLSHSAASVVKALREHHPFFCRVFSEGAVVHQSEAFQFDIGDNDECDADRDHTKTARECKRSFELSENFLALASDALGSGTHDVGVFLLHQAMEQLCIASIAAHLQYRPTTHSTVRLIALVGCYLPQARNLFPRSTSDERELFDYLHKAYSDVRYKVGYRVPAHIAFSLLERVYEFRHLIEERYKKEFGSGGEAGAEEGFACV